jgi:hypothetical protein
MSDMWRGISAAVLAVSVVSGCGEAAVRPAPPVSASCANARHVATAMPGESGVYRAGPLTLAVGVDLAQASPATASRVSGSEAVAIVTGSRQVVLRVDSAAGAHLSLQFAALTGPGHDPPILSDGRTAIRFPPCPSGPRRFFGGILFSGSGCARLRVERPGSAPATLLIPIAGSVHGCPDRPAAAGLSNAALPFIGVACRRPNAIACDRVGVGVWLDQPATLVVASIAGRLVTLSPPLTHGRRSLWVGYLLNAGLHRRGPLQVLSQRGGLWSGTPEVAPRAQVRAWLADGRVATTPTVPVLLHPGFG